MRRPIVLAAGALLLLGSTSLAQRGYRPHPRDVVEGVDYTRLRFSVVVSPRIRFKPEDAEFVRGALERIRDAYTGGIQRSMIGGMRATRSTAPGRTLRDEADEAKAGYVFETVIEGFLYDSRRIQWRAVQTMDMRTTTGWRTLRRGGTKETQGAVALPVPGASGRPIRLRTPPEIVVPDVLLPVRIVKQSAGEDGQTVGLEITSVLPYPATVVQVRLYGPGEDGTMDRAAFAPAVHPAAEVPPFGKATCEVTFGGEKAVKVIVGRCAVEPPPEEEEGEG